MNVASRDRRMNCHGHDRLGRNNDAVQAEVRLYDRLFKEAHPGTSDKDLLEELTADSLKVVTAYVEPSLANVPAGTRFQFERHGYFVTDIVDHKAGKAVFNRVSASFATTNRCGPRRHRRQPLSTAIFNLPNACSHCLPITSSDRRASSIWTGSNCHSRSRPIFRSLTKPASAST